MIFNPKAAQKNAGQKLTDHYLLNELWSDLDETSQAAVSGGTTFKDTLGNTIIGVGEVVFTFSLGVKGGPLMPIEEIGIVGV